MAKIQNEEVLHGSRAADSQGFRFRESWIHTGLVIAGILVTIGLVFGKVTESTKCNKQQDTRIGNLERDMAVIKSTTSRTADDIDELKKDVKILIGRP